MATGFVWPVTIVALLGCLALVSANTQVVRVARFTNIPGQPVGQISCDYLNVSSSLVSSPTQALLDKGVHMWNWKMQQTNGVQVGSDPSNRRVFLMICINLGPSTSPSLVNTTNNQLVQLTSGVLGFTVQFILPALVPVVDTYSGFCERTGLCVVITSLIVDHSKWQCLIDPKTGQLTPDCTAANKKLGDRRYLKTAHTTEPSDGLV